MAEVSIRARRTVDLEQCVEALAVVHRVDRYPLNWPADPRRWLCPAETLHAWVARTDDDAVVGHIALHRVTTAVTVDTPPAVEVGRLFVVPSARRLAVGRRLLRRAQDWAAEHGYDLTLEVVDDRRSAAVALYEAAGWRHTATSEADWTAPDGGPVRLRHYTYRTRTDAGPHR